MTLTVGVVSVFEAVRASLTITDVYERKYVSTQNMEVEHLFSYNWPWTTVLYLELQPNVSYKCIFHTEQGIALMLL